MNPSRCAGVNRNRFGPLIKLLTFFAAAKQAVLIIDYYYCDVVYKKLKETIALFFSRNVAMGNDLQAWSKSVIYF